MRQIQVKKVAGIYSQRDLDTDRILDKLPRNLWAVECMDLDGIPHHIVDDCDHNSQGWTGWTFMTVKTSRPVSAGATSVPLLLFEHKEDAFWAEFRYGSGSRLNTEMEQLES